MIGDREMTSNFPDTELTETEKERLIKMEYIVSKNINVFYEVGYALSSIKTGKLYRAKYATFEKYCKSRFGIARRTAYQYIEAKETMDNVRQGAQTVLPTNERQLRPLARLTSDLQADAWNTVVKSAPENGGITAKLVGSIVDDIVGGEIKKKAEKIVDIAKPIVSKEFSDQLWAIVEVVRKEVKSPMAAKTKLAMIESFQRVTRLLED